MSERDIFIAALQHQDAAARQAYLAEACAGRPEFREQVDGLLRLYENAGSFLEKPAAGPGVEAGTTEPIADFRLQNADCKSEISNLKSAISPVVPLAAPGTVIGPYKLLQQIGEGGMGVVFMAEQTHPVQRKVALKLIKSGLDSRQVIARFEAERQALALMDHPNIAKVLEAGTIPFLIDDFRFSIEKKADDEQSKIKNQKSKIQNDGRPYFVMELVKGVAITNYCDEHHLTPRQRLELFVPVCQALQHAHQKGIIHRDLKPSNVMVALYDSKPVPKIIDFGVAKAAGPKLTERTLFTELGQVVGTFEYMSPEQAQLNQLDIDTRSDIYSLGVLLYELLTGTTPLSRERLKETPLLEVLRLIREEEPPTPSNRLSTTADLPAIAANRGLEPRKLSGLVRGELDWIVMKCLDKDRDRRYETANGLAMDLERYLHDLPVQACPPSAAYRFRKFARRHKAGLAMASLSLFFILLLGGGIGWLARDQALRRGEAEKQFRDSLAVIEPGLRGRNPQAAEVLKAARRLEAELDAGMLGEDLRQQGERLLADLAMLSRLEEIRLGQATLENGRLDFAGASAAYARAFQEYGIDVDALEVSEAAERIRERMIALDLAAALDDWAMFRPVATSSLLVAREKEKVQQDWRRRLEVARRADPDPWRNALRALLARGTPKDELTKLAAAAPIHELSATSVTLLGRALRWEEALESSVTVLRQGQRRYPADFWINFELAWALTLTPFALDEAIGYNRAALALRPRSPTVHVSLGIAFRRKGRFDDAIAHYQQALQLDPNMVEAHGNLGNALRDKGRLDEAIARYRQAIQLKPDLAPAHNGLGLALQQKGKVDEAIACHQEALRLMPDDPEAHLGLGNALRAKGRLDQAIKHYERAIQREPNFAEAYNNLGIVFKETGQLDKAIARYQEAIRRKPDFAQFHNNLGTALEEMDRLDEAIVSFHEAIRLKADYAEAYGKLGAALFRKGKPDEAIAALERAHQLWPESAATCFNLGVALSSRGKLDRAIALMQKAVHLKPGQWEFHVNLGLALAERGRAEEAIAAHTEALRLKPGAVPVLNALSWVLATAPELRLRDPQRAVKLATRAVKAAPKNGSYWNTLGIARYRAGDWQAAVEALDQSVRLRKGGHSDDFFFLALSHWRLGKKEAAREWYEKGIAWMHKNKPQDPELRRFKAEAAAVLNSADAKLAKPKEK